MKEERNYWIETCGKTYLYYQVTASSESEAIERYQETGGEYIGCVDESDQIIVKVLSERPHTDWH